MLRIEWNSSRYGFKYLHGQGTKDVGAFEVGGPASGPRFTNLYRGQVPTWPSRRPYRSRLSNQIPDLRYDSTDFWLRKDILICGKKYNEPENLGGK